MLFLTIKSSSFDGTEVIRDSTLAHISASNKFCFLFPIAFEERVHENEGGHHGTQGNKDPLHRDKYNQEVLIVGFLA